MLDKYLNLIYLYICSFLCEGVVHLNKIDPVLIAQNQQFVLSGKFLLTQAENYSNLIQEWKYLTTNYYCRKSLWLDEL